MPADRGLPACHNNHKKRQYTNRHAYVGCDGYLEDLKMQTPIVELLSLDEVKGLVLQHLLAKSGVENPTQFLKENDVEYVAALRPAVGIALTITSINPKAEEVTQA